MHALSDLTWFTMVCCLIAEPGALGVDMVEYVLGVSPSRKDLDARLRGKGGQPPGAFIQNVSM